MQKSYLGALYDDVRCSPTHGYRIIEFFTIFNFLSDILICHECKNDVKFEETPNRGLGLNLVVLCKCGRRDIRSRHLISNGYEINRRMVFVMRLLGICRDGTNLFCGLMDMFSGLSKHVENGSLNIFVILRKLYFLSFLKKLSKKRKERTRNAKYL